MVNNFNLGGAGREETKQYPLIPDRKVLKTLQKANSEYEIK